MSLCGPRPPLLEEVEQYDAHAFERLSVRPGATGLWQINRKEDLDFDDMLALDLEYIEKRSLWYDLKIIIGTVGVVFTGKGGF
jgi:lipopolysaccharide/colanic/teichoic acid biosynthesis glycosyltransferase